MLFSERYLRDHTEETERFIVAETDQPQQAPAEPMDVDEAEETEAASASDDDGYNRGEENNHYNEDSENELEELEADERLNPRGIETLILNHNDALLPPIEETAPYLEPGQLVLPNTGYQLNRLLAGNAEYSTFPKAYGGQPPVIGDSNAILREAIGEGNVVDAVLFTPPSYSKLSKYELMRYERRAVRPDHLFFKLCKLLQSQLQQFLKISLRQVNQNGQIRTAAGAMNRRLVGRAIRQNKGKQTVAV